MVGAVGVYIDRKSVHPNTIHPDVWLSPSWSGCVNIVRWQLETLWFRCKLRRPDSVRENFIRRIPHLRDALAPLGSAALLRRATALSVAITSLTALRGAAHAQSPTAPVPKHPSALQAQQQLSGEMRQVSYFHVLIAYYPKWVQFKPLHVTLRTFL